MVNGSAVPDAWDDDWEAQADKTVQQDVAPVQVASQPGLSRAERAAHHAEANRKLWESAESPQAYHYIQANDRVPSVTTDLKPQVKVLSRKPMVAKRGSSSAAGSMATLSLGQPDDDDDAASGEAEQTPEELRAKQKREREEKQRRYAEARAKIFGESAQSSGASSPGAVTPPRSDGRNTPRGRGRGRGRGATDGRPYEARPANIQPSPSRELYDPGSGSRPDSSQRRSDARTPANNPQQAPIRSPRGPDGSGRGGAGFTRNADTKA